MPAKENPITIYQGDGFNIETRLDGDHQTIWLTQQQLADLFSKDRDTIGDHIKNIYSEGELERAATTGKFPVVQDEGGRKVSRELDH